VRRQGVLVPRRVGVFLRALLRAWIRCVVCAPPPEEKRLDPALCGFVCERRALLLWVVAIGLDGFPLGTCVAVCLCLAVRASRRALPHRLLFEKRRGCSGARECFGCFAGVRGAFSLRPHRAILLVACPPVGLCAVGRGRTNVRRVAEHWVSLTSGGLMEAAGNQRSLLYGPTCGVIERRAPYGTRGVVLPAPPLRLLGTRHQTVFVCVVRTHPPLPCVCRIAVQ